MLRARNYVTKKCLMTLCYSYIYPCLIYNIGTWGILPHTHFTPLLLFQKKIVRIMTYSTFYAHTAPIFKELQILNVDKFVVHRIAIVMYKSNNGLLPAVLNTLYKKKNEIHSYNTRSRDLFHVALGTQTFLNISARIWNALIIKIDINVPIFKFKDSLKVFFLDNILTITYSK